MKDQVYEFVDWLVEFLEEKENKKIHKRIEVDTLGFSCFLTPKNTIGNPFKSETGRPAIRILFTPKEKVVDLQWLYLNKQRNGTGTRIVTELIKFCKNNGIKELWFNNATEEGEVFFSKIGYDEKTSAGSLIKYL